MDKWVAWKHCHPQGFALTGDSRGWNRQRTPKPCPLEMILPWSLVQLAEYTQNQQDCLSRGVRLCIVGTWSKEQVSEQNPNVVLYYRVFCLCEIMLSEQFQELQEYLKGSKFSFKLSGLRLWLLSTFFLLLVFVFFILLNRKLQIEILGLLGNHGWALKQDLQLEQLYVRIGFCITRIN